jgi:hypothetical protein
MATRIEPGDSLPEGDSLLGSKDFEQADETCPLHRAI